MEALLSEYYATLSSEASKSHYGEKLRLIQGIDPYELKNEWKDDLDLWPEITYIHVWMYLIITPSPYTEQDMLNYKSLDLYQNFIKGWVRQVLVKDVGDNRIMISKV